MKISKLFIGLIIFSVFVGCEEDIPPCASLVWEKSVSTEEFYVGARYSARNMCENYSDYYDADLNELISKIQSMKFILRRECETDPIPPELPKSVDCPVFVPETIEFGELTECSFGTPQQGSEDEVATNCNVPDLRLRFNVEGFSQTALWTFYNVDDPKFRMGKEYLLGRHSFDIFENKIFVAGYFKNENLTLSGIVFEWTEGTEEKRLEFEATVTTGEEIEEPVDNENSDFDVLSL